MTLQEAEAVKALWEALNRLLSTAYLQAMPAALRHDQALIKMADQTLDDTVKVYTEARRIVEAKTAE